MQEHESHSQLESELLARHKNLMISNNLLFFYLILVHKIEFIDAI